MKNFFKSNYFRLLAAILLLAASYVVNKSRLFEPDNEGRTRHFVNTLHEKENRIEKEILLLIKKSSQQNYENLFSGINYYHELFEEEGFLFFIYEKDSLRFWTSNFAPLDAVIDTAALTPKLLRLKNGWYEVIEKKEKKKRFVGLILIKTAFPIENKYLDNRFQPDFDLPRTAGINPPRPGENQEGRNSKDIAENEFKIKSSDRQDLGSITFSGTEPVSMGIRFLLTLLNAAGFLFLIGFLKVESSKFSKEIGHNKAILLFIFSLCSLRMVALLLQYPQAFYEMPLFSPEYYAASFLFPSLGDFIINALLIFYICFYLRRNISLSFLNEMKRVEKRRLFYLLLFLLFAFAVMTEYLVKGLIEDSNISFNVNNLLELTGYSYGALISIGLLLFAFFFICDMVVYVFFLENFLLRQLIPAFVISAVPFVFFLVWFGYGTLPLIWTAVIFPLIFYIYRKKYGEYGFANIVVVISVFTLLASYSLIKYVSQKELDHRKVLAEKLSIEEDPIAEILYTELEPKLLSDIIFSNLKYGLANYDKEFFDNALKEKYFSGYLSRYEVESYVFRKDGNPVSAFSKTTREQNYFERLIARSGRPTINDNMIHIEDSEENENYIIKIPVKDRVGKEMTGALYISMESKLQPETAGFPELLLDNKMKAARHLADKKYSFAKYRKERLAERFGTFSYSLSPETYGNKEMKISHSETGSYSHLVFRTGSKNAVILSKPEEGWLEYITTFSYLFAIFGILVLVFLNLRNFPQNLKMKNAGFNYKVQVMVVALMFISMILFGIGTSYYIYFGYNKKNHSVLNEKIHSVLIEVEHKLGSEEQLGEKLKEYITYILTKFSTVFFTDINLYNSDGTLLASSRPKLFNEGIISKQMDEKAFFQIKFLQKSEFIQDEKIGGLHYHSAYIPFKNKNGEVLAYLNLPYFARQDTLEDEISSFLMALINIYVFLFAFSLVAALFISNAVTRPLQFVQSMLSRVELGKTNKPIEYKGRDEIGRLVKVYNDKVSELEKSAELLARSERESAWREMAKQVAHEIKNPLTPMRLSVQHLQRALKEDTKNQEELLNRFTQTMIEQIDALSAIASEFSNFAKMPKAKNEPLSLISLIESALLLFKETPGIKFIFKTDLAQARVFADKEQLQRAFINLIQNSIQAIPKGREGIIKISLGKKVHLPAGAEDGGASIIVRIEDNGTGIAPEQMDKIFSPNFTTKTTGMGLGLAMVKNIIETLEGRIWFETQMGSGTVFFVEIREWAKD